MPKDLRATLEMIELHVWPRHGNTASLDLSVARSTPRRGVGAPLLDVGLLVDDGVATARSIRSDAPRALAFALGRDRIRGTFGDGPDASFELGITPLFQRTGLLLANAEGEISALGRSFPVHDAMLLLTERRSARRPYAWARVTVRGEIDELPIICIVETARRRAGSVVLPELGRMHFYGPGARALPRACAIAPLPLRAEYGTGRLRASALAPGLRLSLEVDAPPAKTGLFEVVDPSGEAAYAHRALGATARLRIVGRRGVVADLTLDGRYEWGARAGDPRVALRAWRG